MQIKLETTGPTNVKLQVTADQATLDALKTAAIGRLSRNLKLSGFRAGKAPLHLVEKQLDQQLLQSEFLETAVNRLYVDAIQEQKLRPVAQPKVDIMKFVPYATLEVSYELEVLGSITLPDLSKLSLAKPEVKVTAKDVDEVVANLRARAATKEEVKRVAKDGDEVTINFSGVDTKTKEPITGATGTDYPLVLGSNSFIPGFEPELIGLKAGDSKDFPITFPADYSAVELQKRKVTFSVTVNKVQAVTEPKLDDAFAATVGPFKALSELKGDIKKQLEQERAGQAERAYENQLLELIAGKTKVNIPTVLIDEEIERIEAEEKREVVYRGQTWQQHLDAEQLNEDQHREKQRPAAELRVKAGLVLGEIADQEKIIVEPAELEAQIQALKQQYTDPAMQAELGKPENRRDILSRILSQKSLERVKQLIGK
ncbi:MAG: trigger factor [Patescibacteria group bacterium]|nr:trigger factor [Patescibacteria group bacterium]